MRCPKCHYLSFDPDPRCKNCGYDLEIDAEVSSPETDADLDLRIAPVATVAAPDLPLRSQKPAASPALALVGVAATPEPVRRTPAKSAAPTTELPLFVKTMGPQELGSFAELATVFDGEDTGGRTQASETAERSAEKSEPTMNMPAAAWDSFEDDEDALLETPAAHVPPAPRPLSVRRPVETPRPASRTERRPGPLDHDLLEDLRRLEREEAIRSARDAAPSGVPGNGETASSPVAISHRLGAAAFDGLLLGGIAAFVLWATLKVADASPSSLGVAALVPMGVFVAAVSVSYLLMFTAAGGQTVGKMLMGIRVVDDTTDDGDRLTLGQAAGRAILAPLSVAMLGLGWLPALFGRGQALHDRVVHTRVVRA